MSTPRPAQPRPAGSRVARRSSRAAAVLAAAGLMLGFVFAPAQIARPSAQGDVGFPGNREPSLPLPQRSWGREQGAGAPQAVAAPLTLPLPERYALATVWQSPLPYPGIYHPEGLDVARDGLIYVAERGNHRVSVWHQNGDPNRTIGTPGDAPGQLRAPEDVAVDADRDRLYVADTGNRRVTVFHRRTGALVATWAEVGLPRGIAVGADGRVYVADAEGQRIHVFDADGNPVASWGEAGGDPGELDTPLGLAVAADGLLYIADSGNQRVQWWDMQGGFVGQLDLSNAGGPGGVPQDVGVDAAGDLFVAVERGVLRFRGRTASAYASTLPPLREVLRQPPCPNPCSCRDFVPEIGVHEGVRRLSAGPVGLFFTFAPGLRFHDRVVAMPRRAFETVLPSAICAGGPSLKHIFDPSRIDASSDPYFAHVLDSSGVPRVFRSDGRLGDPGDFEQGWPGVDIAAGLGEPRASAVLTGNQVQTTDLRCELGCPPGVVRALDPDMVMRRDATGERVPDFLWWNRAVALYDAEVLDARPRFPSPRPLRLAILDTGRQRLIERVGLDLRRICDVGCPLMPTPQPPTQLTVGAQLGAARDPFRAFRDISYDPNGHLWVLARDGGLLHFDPRGRRQADLVLAGLRNRPVEALGVSIEGGQGVFFVLTADEWVFKFARDGEALAAWSIEREAGPGRYRDLTVDDRGRVLVPDGAGDRVLVFDRADGPVTEPVPDPRGGPCTVEPDKIARPARLPLGATTTVTLTLAADCGEAHAMLDVVLAIDASCMMTGDRLAKAREAGARLVDAMVQPRDRVGVVAFNDQAGSARLLMPLTGDKAALKGVLAAFRTDCQPIRFFPDRRSDAKISDGLRAGREALYGPADRPAAGKALVLLSPSAQDRERVERMLGRWMAGSIDPPVPEREHAMWEAWRLWEAGARVYTVGVGLPSTVIGPPPPPAPDLQSTHEPDQGLLASLANPAAGYRMAAAPGDLPGVYANLGREISARSLYTSLVITDRIPANMHLVPGSTRPLAQVLPEGGRPDALLRWTFTDVGFAGPPALSYVLEPLAPGRWPTNVDARAIYTDGLDYPGEAIFPIPTVEVIAPSPSATRTNEATPTGAWTPTVSATPTSTSTATIAGSATPGRAPTRTRTPRPRPIHLPILFYDQCVPQQVPLDVVLAIDTSSSMNGAKIDTAKAAARVFVDYLDMPRDHAAVIGFDEAARLAQGLTGDRAAVEAALGGLFTAVGTRIDRGLWAAVGELGGPGGRRGADRVIVLLTDGRPHAGSEPSIREASKLARDLGAKVYVIGLGEDLLQDILAQITGDPRRVYLAPTEADLARIYGDVARVIPCR